MMNYSCDRFLDPHDVSEWNYAVRETRTEQVITTFTPGIPAYASEARRYTKFLNNGGAFDGFTPSFVLVKVEIPIDQEFASEFSH